MLDHLANSQRINHGSSTQGSKHHYSWGLWSTAALKASSNGLPFETNLHCATSIYSQIDLSAFEDSLHIYHLSLLKSLWLYVGDLLTSINACYLQTANYSDVSAKWDCILRLVRFNMHFEMIKRVGALLQYVLLCLPVIMQPWSVQVWVRKWPVHMHSPSICHTKTRIWKRKCKKGQYKQCCTVPIFQRKHWNCSVLTDTSCIMY